MNESWEDFLPRPLLRFGQILADLAAVALFAMMMLTIVDIVGRSLGFPSIEAVIEISSLSVLIIVFFGLASCTAAGGHILIDLFTRNNRPRTNQLIDAFWLLIMAVLLGAMAWFSLGEGLAIHNTGERTEIMEISPLTFTVPSVIGMAFCSLVSMWLAIKLCRNKFRDSQVERAGDI